MESMHSASSSSHAPVAESTSTQMITEVKKALKSPQMLHQLYRIAYNMSNNSETAFFREESVVASTTTVTLFIRTILFVCIHPKSTFRKEDLAIECRPIIQKVLNLLDGTVNFPVFTVSKDPRANFFPSRNTIEGWVKLLKIPLVMNIAPMEILESEQIAFQDWIKNIHGLTSKKTTQKRKQDNSKEPKHKESSKKPKIVAISSAYIARAANCIEQALIAEKMHLDPLQQEAVWLKVHERLFPEEPIDLDEDSSDE